MLEENGWNIEHWEREEWIALGKGEVGLVGGSQLASLNKWREGMLFIKIVENGQGALWRQEGIKDSAVDLVHLRCLQNSQGKEKPSLHLQNESGREVRAWL